MGRLRVNALNHRPSIYKTTEYGYSVAARNKLDPHWNLAYSALACLKIGISGSASFHRVRKS